MIFHRRVNNQRNKQTMTILNRRYMLRKMPIHITVVGNCLQFFLCVYGHSSFEAKSNETSLLCEKTTRHKPPVFCPNVGSRLGTDSSAKFLVTVALSLLSQYVQTVSAWYEAGPCCCPRPSVKTLFCVRDDEAPSQLSNCHRAR